MAGRTSRSMAAESAARVASSASGWASSRGFSSTGVSSARRTWVMVRSMTGRGRRAALAHPLLDVGADLVDVGRVRVEARDERVQPVGRVDALEACQLPGEVLGSSQLVDAVQLPDAMLEVREPQVRHDPQHVQGDAFLRLEVRRIDAVRVGQKPAQARLLALAPLRARVVPAVVPALVAEEGGP